MHDLDTIVHLNDAAVASEIKTARAQGQYIVATYQGEKLLGYKVHDNAMDAMRQLNTLATRGQHRCLYSPLPPEPAPVAPVGYDWLVACCLVGCAVVVGLLVAGWL